MRELDWCNLHVNSTIRWVGYVYADQSTHLQEDIFPDQHQERPQKFHHCLVSVLGFHGRRQHLAELDIVRI